MQAIKLDRKRSILVIILLASLVSLQSCRIQNKNGAATPDRVVEQYLNALEARNETSVRRLMPEESIAIDRIQGKIARLGGYKIEERQIKYIKTKPSLWNAKLHGFYVDRAGIKRKFEDSIVLEYQSKGELKLYAGHWYLLL